MSFIPKSPAILFRILPISPAIFLAAFRTSPAILHGFCVPCRRFARPDEAGELCK